METAPRFTKIDRLTETGSEHIVTLDNLTNLHWTAGDAIDQDVNHEQALAAIAKLNEQAFGGFTDWRMPEVEELFLLADRSRHSPAIDIEFFPTCKSDWYWSATDDATEDKDEQTGHSKYAWVVHFDGGHSSNGPRDYCYRVRAARGPSRQ